MRNQGLTFLLLAFLGVIFTLQSCKKSEPAAQACSPDQPPACCSMLGTMSSNAVLLMEKDSGGKISVKKGETIVISLRANPTTGFNWYLHPLPECLMSRGNPEYKPENDKIGGGGLWSLRLMPMAAGSGTVSIDYKRSFEGGKEPAKVFTVSVEVK